MEKKNYTIIGLSLALLITLTIVNAEQQTLGSFKKDSCIDLIQICSNCTYNNVTVVIYPNSSILNIDSEMTKNGITYNLTFCDTSKYGDYLVYGVGDLNGINTVWGYDFIIIPSEEELTIGMAILFAIGIIFLTVTIILSIFGIINATSIQGKYGCICITYLLLMGLSFTAWTIAKSYLTNMTFMVGVLYTIWLTLMILFLPFIILSFAYITIAITKMKLWKELVNKGFTEEEADIKAFGKKR